MKNYLIIAASALALASCSSEDFVGTEGGNVENGANKAINFSGNAGKITRATKNTGNAAEMLDGQFKIYGVKKASDDKFKNVFVDYSVWDATANTTTSNTKGWEYVGAKNSTNLGTGKISLGDEAQTIKYWDYSASEYRFVAGSPISAFQFNKNKDIADKGTYITSATISGLAGHIEANKEGTALNTDPVYVATPKVVKKYQEPVTFEFNRQQAMVRVGIYETIPGYAITAIKFYAYDKNGDLKVTDKNNIILTSGTADYFVGGSITLREPLIMIGQKQLLHTPTHIQKVLQRARTGMQVILNLITLWLQHQQRPLQNSMVQTKICHQTMATSLYSQHLLLLQLPQSSSNVTIL